MVTMDGWMVRAVRVVIHSSSVSKIYNKSFFYIVVPPLSLV